MKNSKLIKIVSLISALCLCIGSFPASVAAATTGYEEYEPSQWITLDLMTGIEQADDSVTLTFQTSVMTEEKLICSFPAEGGIRIRCNKEGFFSPSGNKNITLTSEENGIYANTSDAALRVVNNGEGGWQIILYNKFGVAVKVYDKSSLLLGCNENGTVKKFKTVSSVASGEIFYGLGERFNGLFQNGKRIELWNYDSVSELKYEDGDHSVGYKNIPLLHSSSGYSVFYNTSYYGLADIGYTDSSKYSFTFDGPEIDFYVFVNGNDENLSSYLDLTGNTVIPPKWALSYWAGQTSNVWRCGTKDEATTYDNVKTVLEKYDALGTPIKNVYAEGCWYFDTVMEYFQSRNIHVFGWTDSTWRTFDGADNSTPAADVAEAAGISSTKYPLVRKYSNASSYYKQKDGAYWVDYTDSLSVDWLKARFKKSFQSGLQGMMVDYADSLGVDSLFSNLKNGSYMHNRYAYYYDKAMQEAFSDYWCDDFILFARAACAGSQHYVASFGGDQSSSFLGLKQSVSAMLSAAASGIAVWGSDIGGYGTSNDANKNDPEVYARWLQFGTFSPLMRTHGSSSRNPWSYDSTGESEKRFKFYYWTRENILNYVYSNMVNASVNNSSIVKSMAAAFEQQDSVRNNQTQYMFGEELLVCPVTEQSASSLSIDFPSGKWYDLWNGGTVEGGKSITVSADLDTIPVYLRDGAVLPVTLNNSLKIGDAFTDESLIDAIIVTPASENRAVTLYGENGASQSYSCFTDNQYGYMLESDNVNSTKIIMAYGINADKITVDGVFLEKLPSIPDGTCQGYYYDSEQNRTIVSTGGQWSTVSYANDSVLDDCILSEEVKLDFTDPELTLDDVDKLFDSYYIEDSQSNVSAQSTSLSDSWSMDDGYLRNNQRDDSTNSYYKKVSYLTLSEKRTLGFEVTVDYKQAWKYHGILFGMKNPQNYVINEKPEESMFAIYVDSDGRVMLHGNYDNMPANHKIYQLSGYSATDDIKAGTVRSLTVRVVNNELTVIADNNPDASVSVRLNGYDGGYISLFSADGTSGGFTGFRAVPIFNNVASTGFLTSDISSGISEKYAAYTVEDLSVSSVMTKGSVSELWKKNTQGRLSPTQSTEGTDFKNLTVLTDTGRTYTDFEATITFQQSNKRFGIMFGTKDGEFAYTGTKAADVVPNGGVLVYAESGGVVVAAGEAVSGNSSRPYYYRDGNATLSSFTDGGTQANIIAKKMHTLSIKVCDGILTVILDGIETSKTSITLTDNYKGGYVSLVSNGKKASGCFESFSIKPIAEVNEGGNADYAFSDLENLDSFKSDFDAYKIASTATSAVMTSGNIEDIWTIDTAKKLARNSNKEGSDFSDLSVLTYNKDTYENFEATITFQQSYKRYGIMFGTKDGEFAYTGTKTGDVAPNGGVLVFAEAEGVVVAAGEAVSGKSSRPYYYRDGNAKFSSFTDGGTSANIAAKKMHTLSIKVCDGILTVILDGLEETKTDITLTENYKGGYVSLVSNGKKTSGCFESFSIKPIAEVNEGGNADDESFDGYKFSNLKNLDSFKSDFDAYKIASTATSAVMTSGNIEDIWTVDTAKKLARNSNTEGTDFSDLSVLTYNKDTYENFEATITFQQSNKRYGIMFGTKDGEFAYTGTKAADVVPNGGVLVFAEAAGVVVAAGEVISGNSSRPYYYRDGNATLSSFTDGGTSANIAAKKMHTLSIKVCDGILTVILDGLEETKTDITLTDNYKGGYVSLVSNGKKASGCFESFSVKSVTAEEDTTDYSNIDFENISSVKKLAKDFETYYIEDASVSADAVKQEIVDAWIINNGKKLVRNTKTEGNDTKNLTMLTYTNKAFTDFELVTTYTQTYNRLGVIFGTDKGEFVIDDTSTERKANGVMVYIEAEGTRTAIGSLDGGYTNSAKKIRRITSPTLTGFKDENGKSSIGTVHTLKIVVKGKQAFIFVDDMENYCMYFTLPETYNGGYISLFSTASSSYGFGKFSVSETIKTDITTGGYTSDGTTISFNFDDIAMSTEYFDAYYLDGVESGLSKVKFSDYWEISDGKLYRKSKTTASSDVSDLAVITYNQQTYKDFKATVKYQKCGGRLMLMFGTDGKSYPITDSKAKTANNKGLAVYLENNFGTGGSLVSLGALPATTSSARTRTTDIMVEGYSKKGEWNYNRGTWHTLQIWVCNSKCYIFLDEYGLLTSYDLPEDYNGGYISLVSSQCAGLGFDDFTITDISNTEKNEIVDFDKVRDIKVKLGTVQSQIGLPKTMTVTSLNGKKHTVEVEWFCENYSPDKKGYYEFIGDIMPSDSITNPGYFKCKIGVSVIDYDTSVVKKWEFDSADDLLDFEAFTIKNITESPDSVWCNKYDSWSIKDGLLQHKSATEGSNTKNLSILTYTGEKYKNFEVNVSYKQYYTRCMVLFGSEDAGQYIFDDVNFKTNNAVATYVEFESKRVAMGNVEYPDKGYTITEEYPAISDYVQINENGKKKYGVFHNMRIVVQGNIGEIYVDDAETPLKIYLPEDRKEGYISLVTTGKNDAFDYLSIERLPEAKNQQVANNKIMANGYLDVKNVDRLEATQKPNSIDKNDVTPVETQPSKVNLFNILIFALGGLSVIFMITVFAYTIYKKRKQK